MKKMKAKTNKLKSMSFDEVFFRLIEKVIEEAESYDHRLKSKRLRRDKNGGFSSTDVFFTNLYEKGQREELLSSTLVISESWLDAADEILNGTLCFLGTKIVDDQCMKWNHDPLSDIKWPGLFYKRVSQHKQIKDCDVKYVWELNRHQYLIVLAKAYWLTSDEKYAEKIVSIINDWIDGNPYNTGVNWTSSLELAVRSISWIWAYFLCQGSLHITPEFCEALRRSLYEHGLHISRHLSYYSSPYNHLIGEAAGLHLIGIFCSGFKRTEKWEALAWKILEDQIEKQFHEDGMCVEQASFYHHFTLGFYLQSVFLRRYNQKNVSDRVMKRLEKALEFSMYLTKPDGTLPMIGDIDNARSLYFGPGHSWDFRGFLGLGAVLFDRPDFKAMCGGVSEEMFWILSDEDMDRYHEIDAAFPSDTSRAFHTGGYYILRDSWAPDANYLCFDCGEIAHGLSDRAIPSAAHGHADALSFELSAYGQTIIAEGGFYTYFGELDWHTHFRHEEAHNTVQIGAYRQAEYCGRLTWQKVKKPVLNTWVANDDYQYISGTIKYNKYVSHTRQVFYFNNAFWFFNDRVSVEEPGTQIKTSFNFDPAVTFDIDEAKKQIVATNGETGIVLAYFNDAELNAVKGEDRPSGGWSALGYGIKSPAWSIQLAWYATGKSTDFPFVIIPWKEGRGPISVDGGDSKEKPFNATVSINDRKYTLGLGRDRSLSVNHGGVEYKIG